jgi:hypothetical protein
MADKQRPVAAALSFGLGWAACGSFFQPWWTQQREPHLLGVLMRGSRLEGGDSGEGSTSF